MGDWDHLNELEKRGFAICGQMTAGSSTLFGTHGIVKANYEMFAEVGRQNYGGTLRMKWILTAGLGHMGGGQPLATVMAGATALC